MLIEVYEESWIISKKKERIAIVQKNEQEKGHVEIKKAERKQRYSKKATFYIIVNDTVYEIPELDARYLSTAQIGAYVYKRFGRDALLSLKVIKNGKLIVS